MTELLDNLEALRSPPPGGAVVDRSDRGFVHVTGPDALSFLQALVSADLEAVDDGGGAESLLLHPQGKLDVAFRLVRVAADDLWLDTEPGLAPQLVTSLERFKIRVDVTVADRSGDRGMLTLVGPGVGSVVEPSCIVVASRLGLDVLGTSGEIAVVRARLVGAGAIAIDAGAWEAFRIERGIPRQPVDVDDSTIPQEAELELDAVSFTKGCFIGQELVCRIDSRGHVNRFLRRLTGIDGARPAPGTEIVDESGKVVGAVTSVTSDAFPAVALGYVRREVEPSATVLLRSPSGSAHARVEPLRPDA